MKCKVCSSDVQVRSDPDLCMVVPDGFPLSGALNLAICPLCNFVFNDSPSDDADYTSYYTKLNKHQSRDGALKELDIRYFSELLQFLVDNTQFKVDGSSILDYGSGALLFSELALAKGAKNAINYDIGKPKVDGNHDMVVSTHCFEHIVTPNAAFNELAQNVADGGLVCMAVPDLGRYLNAYYGPYAHFDLEHVNHFSLPSLQRLFERNGFDVVAVRHSDRMVTPTLAYSEILVVGKKGAPCSSFDTAHASGFSAIVSVEALLDRSAKDMQIMLSSFKSALSEARERGDFVIGIYGLASYAFRFIGILKRNDLLKYVAFFADSDPRMSQFSYGPQPIFDKHKFREYVKSQLSRQKTIYVVIAAINGLRIKKMFQDEFADPRVIVKLLPPDCQNRQGV